MKIKKLVKFIKHLYVIPVKPANKPKKLTVVPILFLILIMLASMNLPTVASPQADENTYQVYLPVAHSQNSEWAMLAANPERTSWTPEEVRGSLRVEWYRPIEPYIPYKIQPIAANGKIFVSTAKGLYAFSASNGQIAWVYPTELPLGHSPTIANINGKAIVYVGGYDHKIHAIDASNGTKIPGYTPFEAGAGFETNPLIINNTIYVGNRDGVFYALDAVSGNLKWRYATGGPILFSAAYKNGVVYFASNDSHAYALNANNGSLIWKSEKLGGAGFHSYWPVIYTNRATGKSYVIFTGSENYIQILSLPHEETYLLFDDIPLGGLIGPTNTSVTGDWVNGTTVIDASKITNYYQSQPYRRTEFVLDAETGLEFTFDSNSDGKSEYAPFSWSGVTNSGNKYPPVINGVDGVYYQATAYYNGGWISRGGTSGWKFGTQYISRVDGNEVGHASDEPLTFSSGGRLIYWGLCCDREAGGMDVTIPFGQPGRSWMYFGYNLASNVLAPGYQEMYNGGDDFAYNNLNGWQIFSGPNQSKNGIYGKHMTTQSPPIPYQGKLFFLRGNALLAFSANGTNPKTPLPLAVTTYTSNTSITMTKNEYTQKLENEILKIINAGPFRPGYHSAGMIDQYGFGQYTDEREFGEIFDYFQNPSDTVYTFLLAYPYLSPTTQNQVKAYLQNNYGPGGKYDFTKIVHVGWGTGAAREIFNIPPEVTALWGQPYVSPYEPSTQPICGICGYWQNFPPFSFYAAWKYAQIVGNNDQVFAKNIFDLMSSKLEPPLADTVFLQKPYWLNLYIAGYQGYLALQQLAGYSPNSTVLTRYQHLLDLRISGFSKDTPFPPIGSDIPGAFDNNTLAVARNFMFLTPELGDYLSERILSQVQTAVDEYTVVAPYWFVPKFDASYGEGTLQHLYDSPSLFQAKAWILKQPFTELVKWIDVPAFYRGDLFYIQNLVAALSAP
jgi:outer membrane protein assembly factor BamB